MPKHEIKQIMINGKLIGIAGLDDAIKEISKIPSNSDKEIQKMLLDLISSQNYIPATMQNAYAGAILREFKIAQGLIVAPEHIPGLRIAVLGAGCTRCTQLETDVRDTLSELKIAADLRHISDVKDLAGYGLLGFPALAINDKVVYAGAVPPKSEIRRWIIESCNFQSNV